MSHIWQKADDKCHHCKESFEKEGKVVKVVWFFANTRFECKKCGEVNSWQDPLVGKFSSFMFWMGRKYW